MLLDFARADRNTLNRNHVIPWHLAITSSCTSDLLSPLRSVVDSVTSPPVTVVEVTVVVEVVEGVVVTTQEGGVQ